MKAFKRNPRKIHDVDDSSGGDCSKEIELPMNEMACLLAENLSLPAPRSQVTPDNLAKITLKLVFVGNPGVGKTSLCRRFSRKTVRDQYEPTQNLEFHSRFALENNRVELHLWDTDGHDALLTRNAYAEADAILICLDSSVEAHENRQHLEIYLAKVKERAPSVAVYALLTKSDLPGATSVNDLQHPNCITLGSCSAKTGVDVEEILQPQHFLCQAHTVPTLLKDMKALATSILENHGHKHHPKLQPYSLQFAMALMTPVDKPETFTEYVKRHFDLVVDFYEHLSVEDWDVLAQKIEPLYLQLFQAIATNPQLQGVLPDPQNHQRPQIAFGFVKLEANTDSPILAAELARSLTHCLKICSQNCVQPKHITDKSIRKNLLFIHEISRLFALKIPEVKELRETISAHLQAYEAKILERLSEQQQSQDFQLHKQLYLENPQLIDNAPQNVNLSTEIAKWVSAERVEKLQVK